MTTIPQKFSLIFKLKHSLIFQTLTNVLLKFTNATRTLTVRTLLDLTIANVKMAIPEMEERAKVKKDN